MTLAKKMLKKLTESVKLNEMNKRAIMQKADGNAIITFDSSNDVAQALNLVKDLKSPYSGDKLKYDKDGEKRLFVSSFMASKEITTIDYKMIATALNKAGFEVTDKTGMVNFNK